MAGTSARRLKFRLRTSPSSSYIITGDQTTAVGAAASVRLQATFAVESWALGAGSSPNGVIQGNDILSLLDVSTANSFSFNLRASNATLGTVPKTIMWTLVGAGSLGQVTGLTAGSVTTTSSRVTFNVLAGASVYKHSRDGEDAALLPMTIVSTVGSTVTANITGLTPGVAYLIKVCGTNGASVGALSTGVIVTTTATSAVGPPAVTLAVRSRTISNALTFQCRLHFTDAPSGYCFWANRLGTNDPAAVNGTGWVKLYMEPLAAVGMKWWRTPPAQVTAGEIATKVILYANANYGCKFDIGLNVLATYPSQPSKPNVTTLIERMHATYPNAVRRVMGLNEHNHDTNPTWRDEVIAQGIAINAAMAVYPDWANVKIAAFPPFLRDYNDIQSLLAYTTPGGKTWTAHVAPGLDEVNIHWYPQGKQVTVCDTGQTTHEGDVSIDITLPRHQELSPVGQTLPGIITEFGYQAIFTTVDNVHLTAAARSKYHSHAVFDFLERGINVTTFFELLSEIGDSHPYPLVVHTLDSAGAVSFAPTQSYYTLLNLLTACYDNHANAETFTPGSLSFALSDDVSSPGGYNAFIRHYHFQKNSDGKHYIAIWYDWQSWNKTTASENFQSRICKLTLGSSAVVATNRPHTYTTFSAATWIDLNGGVADVAFTLTVPDDVMLLRIG